MFPIPGGRSSESFCVAFSRVFCRTVGVGKEYENLCGVLCVFESVLRLPMVVVVVVCVCMGGQGCGAAMGKWASALSPPPESSLKGVER